MKTLAIICARGASKGLPGKNILYLEDKPLIGWAIEQARAVKRIDRVIVSTDSHEIRSCALDFGAEAPFIRPVELAQDDSPEWLVWRHLFDYLEQKENYLPDIFISIPTTAPLRSLADIENCLDLYNSGKYDIVITTTEARRNPYFNMVQICDDELVRLVIPSEGGPFRRQDAKRVYDMATVAYVSNPDFVRRSDGIFEGRVGAVQVPAERAIDIDSALDFRIAKFLMSGKG